MYNIAIRADGGPAVGMGHIMRCLVLAEELKKWGARVYFISQYDHGIRKVLDSGFEAFKLQIDQEPPAQSNLAGFDYGNESERETDLNQTKKMIDQQGCDLLVIDKYHLNTAYFDEIRSWRIQAAFIDDLNLFSCPAQFIINGNINAEALGYKKAFDGQKLLLGSRYTLLRNEFRGMGPREAKSFTRQGSVPEILITTGGADPYHCTEKIMTALLQDSKTANFRLNVLVGPGFVYTKNIQALASKYSNVNLYVNHGHISEVMLRSDVAISSGGSTLYELCCCGTPTLAFILAENQKGIVEALDSKACIASLGWYTGLESSNLAEKIFHWIINTDIRLQYSQRMQVLIDGKGASRVANELLSD